MSTSPYAPKDGRPKTLLSVVGILDVLGFKEEIREATRKGQADTLLEHFSSRDR